MNLYPLLPLAPVIAGVFGLLVGSFLNVVLYRVPKGESVVFPPSRCPACGHPLRPLENIPVLSWIVLGGRCSACRASISIRYPLVELLTGAAFALAVTEFGPTFAGLAAAALGAVLIAVLFFDLDHLLILLDRCSIRGRAPRYEVVNRGKLFVRNILRESALL